MTDLLCRIRMNRNSGKLVSWVQREDMVIEEGLSMRL